MEVTENDYYIEYYVAVNEIINQYVVDNNFDHPVATYLFQQSHPIRNRYNNWRKEGKSINVCKYLLNRLLLPVNHCNYKKIDAREYTDIKSHPWNQFYASFTDQVIIYIYNNRQLNYLLPLINSLNRPILLLCESDLDENIKVNENVTAIEMSYLTESKVYKDYSIEMLFPDLYMYYNSFDLLIKLLNPEGIIVLEGCHFQEQILSIVAQKNGVKTIAVQQGWPSFIHTMFRNLPFQYYLTWGDNFSNEFKKYNPQTKFISTGYLYPILAKKDNSIGFFLQAPFFLSDTYYFGLMIELIKETAQKYSDLMILVREHPEYKLHVDIINDLNKYKNIRFVSDLPLSEVFACTRIAVAHYSSIIMESIVHNCIPLVFDPTVHSHYTPNIEKLKLGMISSSKKDFFQKLNYIQNSVDHYINNNISEKDKWFSSISESSIKLTTETINRIIGFNYLKTVKLQCLHIGCGPFLLNNWLNTDICCDNGAYYLDAGRKFPFHDDSFDYIYSEHLFEHLNIYQGINMLEECYRILKSGGRIRLAMPDLRFLIDLYLHPEEETNQKYLIWSYNRFQTGLNRFEVQLEDFPVYVINNYFKLWGHQFIHTPREFSQLGLKIGYKNIHQYPIGESDNQVFKSIENHHKSIPSWANKLETFIIEMEK